jgi:hypothetical protein
VAAGGGVPTVEAFDVYVVLDGNGDAVKRPGRGPQGRRELGDHGVQRRRPLLQALIGGEQLEVRDLAGSAPGLDLADQVERAPEERPVDVAQHRLLGRTVAHRQVAVDAGVRLRRASVELDEPVDRAVEVAGVEAVERLHRDRGGGQHLARELHEDGSIAPLGERIRDREIRHRRCEEHRPVRLLCPEEAEDVLRLLRVGQVLQEALEPRAAPPVELSDVERAAAAEEDPSWLEVVRAEVDERAHRAVAADDRRDQRLVDPVLERDDEAIGSEARPHCLERLLRVLRLHREEDGPERVRQVVRQRCRDVHRELIDRPLDPQPTLVDRLHVLAICVAEQDRAAAPGQTRADRPADRSGTHDDVIDHLLHPGHCLTEGLMYTRHIRLATRRPKE